MKGYMKRNDDFQERRKHLQGLSNDALKARFGNLLKKQ